MYLQGLNRCKLCHWNCNVNRVKGERGFCRIGVPEIAYTSLTHVLKTYSITFLGCSFRCIYCNAYRISQYPDSGWMYRGFVDAENIVYEALKAIKSSLAKDIGVKNISFTGGEPSINLPYLEVIARLIKENLPEIGVGLATNGFSTLKTLKRMERFSSYINFEIKAFDEELHQAITGAPSGPVLDNAHWLAMNHPDKVRVFRTVVIPGINDLEVPKIAKFIKDIDPKLPYRLVGFRPHFLLYYYLGPSRIFMQKLVNKCKDLGLENVDYSGFYPGGTIESFSSNIGALKKAYYVLNQVGCYNRPRICGNCPENKSCSTILREPWTSKSC